jgi:hypothetical protein
MEVNRRVIPKVTKTQHQNPESDHTGGKMGKSNKIKKLANEDLSSIFFKGCIMPTCSIHTILT